MDVKAGRVDHRSFPDCVQSPGNAGQCSMRVDVSRSEVGNGKRKGQEQDNRPLLLPHQLPKNQVMLNAQCE